MKNPFKRYPQDPEVKAAYEKARRQGRLDRAKREGYQKGNVRKPYLIIRVAKAGCKVVNAVATDLNKSFPPAPPPRKRKKRKQKQQKPRDLSWLI